MRQLDAQNRALRETGAQLEQENAKLLLFLSVILYNHGHVQRVMVKDFERMLADGWAMGIEVADIEGEKGYEVRSVRPR